MCLFNQRLNASFENKQVIKVISGINNFNINEILKIVYAAEISGATYIDIAANPFLVSFIKTITNLPICVSSIYPNDLFDCVLQGADLVEIGNFDVFYSKGINLSKNQILKLAEETRSLIPNIDICVTIPHILTLDHQIQLAIDLEKLGINIIQTEGITANTVNNFISSESIDNIYSFTSNASSALSSVYTISNAVNIPIIASSSINAISAPIAFSYGASAVGIRSAISNLNTVYKMSCYIEEIIYSILTSCKISNICPLINDAKTSDDVKLNILEL